MIMSLSRKNYINNDKISIFNKIINAKHAHQYNLPLNLWKETLSWARASYTLEAAVVIPLCCAFLVSLLFLFRVIFVEAVVSEALIETGRTISVEASAIENEEVLLASAEVLFRANIAKYDNPPNLIISLLGSDFSSDIMVLQADYDINMPFSIFSLPKISVSQKEAFRKWTGEGEQTEGLEEYVYITAEGKAYHLTRNCSALNVSTQSTDMGKIAGLRNKDGAKYYACTHCVAKNTALWKVYITNYGREYHKDIDCPALKRTIFYVRLSEVENTHSQCSKCAGKGD